MKVGDLVSLSTYGAKRDFNRCITQLDPYQMGIIVSLSGMYSAYPYKVKWMKCSDIWTGGYQQHSRRELKYAKKKA